MDREHFLDNLRTFLVFSVVGYHSALAYMSPAVFRTALSGDHHIVFDGLVRFWDIVNMPLFFLLSGYFLYPSLKRFKNAHRFMRYKFLYLCVPFLYGIFIFPALNRYLYAMAGDKHPGSFPGYWLNEYINGHIVADHLWFLSFLFILMTVATAILTWFSITPKRDEKTPLPVNAFFILFITAMLSFVFLHGYVADDYWVQLGHTGIFMFQPTRAVLYINFFTFGVVAYIQGWSFTRFSRSLSIKTMGMLTITVVACMELYSLFYYRHDLFANSFVIRFFNGFFHVGTIIVFFCLLIALFLNHFNFQNKISHRLRQSSFAVYIVHFPIVIGFQLVMKKVAASAFLKFGVVFFGASCVSYLVAYYVLNHFLYPYPPFWRNVAQYAKEVLLLKKLRNT